MISNKNFEAAVKVLDLLTSEGELISKDESSNQSIKFSDEFNGQTIIATTLKILHKVVLEGTSEQKAKLSARRDKIKELNSLIKNNSLNAVAEKKLCIKEEKASNTNNIIGVQIALPKTSAEKMLEIATKIPRVALTLAIDCMLLPGALVLLLVACSKADLNPNKDTVKVKKIPILLLHGSGFNETEWVVGRQFLKKDEYGSVFSMNYDGLVSNDSSKGIEDYARDKVSKEVKRIKELTGSDEIIIVGHSMGGLIAGYYAEFLAEPNEVKHVISIASPWQGSPTIDSFWKLGGPCSKEKETKRHQQMSVSGGTKDDPLFRQTLVNKALQSERNGKRKYYNIWSSTDYAVPGRHGNLTEDPRRQRSFSYLGHYALVASPQVWIQARLWLDEIYGNSTGQKVE